MLLMGIMNTPGAIATRAQPQLESKKTFFDSRKARQRNNTLKTKEDVTAAPVRSAKSRMIFPNQAT